MILPSVSFSKVYTNLSRGPARTNFQRSVASFPPRNTLEEGTGEVSSLNFFVSISLTHSDLPFVLFAVLFCFWDL